MQSENAIFNLVIMASMSKVSEISDLACVIEELKKYKARVLNS